MKCPTLYLFFFFNDTATTEIYTLSLHDALPICQEGDRQGARQEAAASAMSFRSRHTVARANGSDRDGTRDRKSTRLNSSHLVISYAVFCLKKKKSTVDGADATHTSARLCDYNTC